MVPMMSLKDEITKAIGAHGLWKARLLSAIETGTSEFAPDQICHDDRCDFGRWLHGSSVPAAAKHRPEYETCRRLHADFHQEAARVLKLALGGHKDQALHAMDRAGRFAQLSGDLTGAMMKWTKIESA